MTRTMVLSDCGHRRGAPRGLRDQSNARIRLPISPPPANSSISGGAETAWCSVSCNTFGDVISEGTVLVGVLEWIVYMRFELPTRPHYGCACAWFQQPHQLPRRRCGAGRPTCGVRAGP